MIRLAWITEAGLVLYALTLPAVWAGLAVAAVGYAVMHWVARQN